MLKRTSGTIRLARAEAAAAYLSDQWQENWQPTGDGRWTMTAQLDDNARRWGIEPSPMFASNDELIETAMRSGFQG